MPTARKPTTARERDAKLRKEIDAAIAKAENDYFKFMKNRVDIDAKKAVREAWSEEIAQVAVGLVRERLRTSELRATIVAQLSAFLSERLVAETLLAAMDIKSIATEGGHFRSHQDFYLQIEDAVRLELRRRVDRLNGGES